MNLAQAKLPNDLESNDCYQFRAPTSLDGEQIWNLIGACPPLDANSLYCNLLQCSHFSNTCILAEVEERILGWVSAYFLPKEPNVIFVWQVAVHDDARGTGLGKRLLKKLVNRFEPGRIEYLQTTITPDNAASLALFKSFARDMNTEVQSVEWFKRVDHFGGLHDTEHLLTIGPFKN